MKTCLHKNLCVKILSDITYNSSKVGRNQMINGHQLINE